MIRDFLARIGIEEELLICAALSFVAYQSAAGRKAPFILVINLQVTCTVENSCQCTILLAVALMSYICERSSCHSYNEKLLICGANIVISMGNMAV